MPRRRKPAPPPPTAAEIAAADLAIAESIQWFASRGLAFTRHNVMCFASDFRGVPFSRALARMYAFWDEAFGGITFTDRWKVTPAVRDQLQALLGRPSGWEQQRDEDGGKKSPNNGRGDLRSVFGQDIVDA